MVNNSAWRSRERCARILSLILADEPTGNLDSRSSAEVMSLFTDLHGQGRTIVMITHEPDIAAYASRVVVLRDGEIVSDRSAKRGASRGVLRAGASGRYSSGDGRGSRH